MSQRPKAGALAPTKPTTSSVKPAQSWKERLFPEDY